MLFRHLGEFAVSPTAKYFSKCCTRVSDGGLQCRRYTSPPPYPTLKPDIGFKELEASVDKKDKFIIDVRSPEEIESFGTILGSINLPLTNLGHSILLPKEDFEVRIGVAKPAASAQIVTYCKRGIRARTAQLTLQAAGYNNVRRYKGSFDEWLEKGGRIIKANKEDVE